jgi:hypothetical protein
LKNNGASLKINSLYLRHRTFSVAISLKNAQAAVCFRDFFAKDRKYSWKGTRILTSDIFKNSLAYGEVTGIFKKIRLRMAGTAKSSGDRL